MSQLDLKKSSIVIPGAWNPAIISPEWAQNNVPEVFQSGKADGEIIAGPTVVFVWTMDGIRVEPTKMRLTLKPAGEDLELLEKTRLAAHGIVSLLPHTPIHAVGLNYVFKLSEDEIPLYQAVFDWDQLRNAYKNIGVPDLLAFRLKQRFSAPNGWIEADFQKRETELVLNFHFPTRDPSSVLSAIDQFAQARDRAEALCASLIKNRNS